MEVLRLGLSEVLLLVNCLNEAFYFMSPIMSGNSGNDAKKLVSELKKYAENKVKLTALTVGEKLSKSVGNSVGKALAVPFLVIAFIFLLVAFALFIGNLLDNMVLGFVVASGPCLFAGLLIYIFAPANISKKMQDRMTEKVIAKINIDSNKTIEPSGNNELQNKNENLENNA